MATYVRTLPNFNAATKRAAYERLALLCSHIDALNTDLLSIVADPALFTITVVLTNPIDEATQRQHLGLEP
jgi:hypothetical protein